MLSARKRVLELSAMIFLVCLSDAQRHQRAVGRQRHHHLYRPGHAPDSCISGLMKRRYWTGAVGSNGKSLIGSMYALDMIYEQQHPKECDAANFLLWVPVRHGIGSNIHVLGQTLAHALSLDRVLIVLDDEEHPFYDTQYCRSGENFHNCYFEPLSSCSIEDARRAAGRSSQDLMDAPEILYAKPDSIEAQKQMEARVIKLTRIPHDDKHLPRPLNLFLSSSTIRPEKHYYWWRAVSAAYIIRPNARTLKAIEERKKSIFPEMTVARGTIAVHVRHGDKWKESELTEDKQYLRVLEELDHQEGERWALSRSVYLSTEDQATVDFFQHLPHWDVSFTQVRRYTDKDMSPMAFAEEIGRSNEMLNSLTSLDIALQCDAYVMTLSSNWCRLIDELRATVRCKADHPLFDAQQNNTSADYDVGWR